MHARCVLPDCSSTPVDSLDTSPVDTCNYSAAIPISRLPPNPACSFERPRGIFPAPVRSRLPPPYRSQIHRRHRDRTPLRLETRPLAGASQRPHSLLGASLNSSREAPRCHFAASHAYQRDSSSGAPASRTTPPLADSYPILRGGKHLALSLCRIKLLLSTQLIEQRTMDAAD